MSSRNHIYVRGVWAHDDPDTPVVMLYEVTDDMCVERMVEIYADGRIVREALGDDPNARKDSPCLCDGLFAFPPPETDEPLFAFRVSHDEFESAYGRAVNKFGREHIVMEGRDAMADQHGRALT